MRSHHLRIALLGLGVALGYGSAIAHLVWHHEPHHGFGHPHHHCDR